MGTGLVLKLGMVLLELALGAGQKPCSGRDQTVRLRCAANGLMVKE
jgi:hypothetical protein